MAATKQRARKSRPTRTNKILGLDGRCALALAIRDARIAYLSQCPQPISPIDYELCSRLAMLSGHLLVLDSKALRGAGPRGWRDQNL